MMASSSGIFNMEKFKSKGGFTLWQTKVNDIPMQQGLAKTLKKNGKPEATKEDAWEGIQLKAISMIRLCFDNNVMCHVVNKYSAPEIWEKLDQLYIGKSLTTKLNLKRQLFGLKIEERNNLLEHISVFNVVRDQLLKIGVKFEEEDKALMLLTSLPDSYNHLVITLLYGKNTIKFDDVTSTLLANDMRKKLDFPFCTDLFLWFPHSEN